MLYDLSIRQKRKQSVAVVVRVFDIAVWGFGGKRLSAHAFGLNARFHFLGLYVGSSTFMPAVESAALIPVYR